MSRPDWDEYFFDIMRSVAKRATCDRGRSGCVIVKDNRIISTGYVGTLPNKSDCDDSGHLIEQRKIVLKRSSNYPSLSDSEQHIVLSHNLSFDYLSNMWIGKTTEHCIKTLHSEMNAILYAAKAGVSLDGSTLYCTMTPCRNCAMAIISVGIKEVKCEKKYQCAEESEKMFEESGVKLFYKSLEIMKYDKTI